MPPACGCCLSPQQKIADRKSKMLNVELDDLRDVSRGCCCLCCHSLAWGGELVGGVPTAAWLLSANSQPGGHSTAASGCQVLPRALGCCTSGCSWSGAGARSCHAPHLTQSAVANCPSRLPANPHGFCCTRKHCLILLPATCPAAAAPVKSPWRHTNPHCCTHKHCPPSPCSCGCLSQAPGGQQAKRCPQTHTVFVVVLANTSSPADSTCPRPLAATCGCLRRLRTTHTTTSASSQTQQTRS